MSFGTNGGVPAETLMRYLDGELPPEERRKVEDALERSTELRRELTLFRTLHEDLSGISFDRAQLPESVWARVNRRLARPIGWLLVGTGIALWTIHAVYLFLTSGADPWEKVATSAIVIGVLILLASVIHERYLEYLTDPYRRVER
jgi:anti-sigma factor RsiW